MEKMCFIFAGDELFNKFLIPIFDFLKEKKISQFDFIKSFSPNGKSFVSPLLSSEAVRYMEKSKYLVFHQDSNKIESLRRELFMKFRSEVYEGSSDRFFLFLSHFYMMSREDLDFFFYALGECRFKLILPFRNSSASLREAFFSHMMEKNKKLFSNTRIKNIDDYYVHVFEKKGKAYLERLNFLVDRVHSAEIVDLDLAMYDNQYFGKKFFEISMLEPAKEFNIEFESKNYGDFISPFDIKRLKGKFPSFREEGLFSMLKTARNLYGGGPDALLADFFEISPFVAEECKKLDDAFISNFGHSPARKSLKSSDGSFFWNYFNF